MKFFLIKLKNSPRPSTKIRNKKNTSLRALHKWLMFMNLFKFYTNRQWLSQFPQFMEPTRMNVLNYRVCFNICKRYTFDIPVRMTTYSLSCHSDVFQSPSRRHIFQNFPRVPGQRLIQTEIYTFQDEIFLFLQTCTVFSGR